MSNVESIQVRIFWEISNYLANYCSRLKHRNSITAYELYGLYLRSAADMTVPLQAEHLAI